MGNKGKKVRGVISMSQVKHQMGNRKEGKLKKVRLEKGKEKERERER